MRVEKNESFLKLNESIKSKIKNIDIEDGLSSPDENDVFITSSMAFLLKYVTNQWKSKLDDPALKNPKDYSNLLCFNSMPNSETYFMKLQDVDIHHENLKKEARKPKKLLADNKILPLMEYDNLIFKRSQISSMWSSRNELNHHSLSILSVFTKSKSKQNLLTNDLSHFINKLSSEFFINESFKSKSISVNTLDTYKSFFKKPSKKAIAHNTCQIEDEEEEEGPMLEIILEQEGDDMSIIFENNSCNSDSDQIFKIASRKLPAIEAKSDSTLKMKNFPNVDCCMMNSDVGERSPSFESSNYERNNKGEAYRNLAFCFMDTFKNYSEFEDYSFTNSKSRSTLTKLLFTSRKNLNRIQSKLSVCVEDDDDSEDDCYCCFERPSHLTQEIENFDH